MSRIIDEILEEVKITDGRAQVAKLHIPNRKLGVLALELEEMIRERTLVKYITSLDSVGDDENKYLETPLIKLGLILHLSSQRKDTGFIMDSIHMLVLIAIMAELDNLSGEGLDNIGILVSMITEKKPLIVKETE